MATKRELKTRVIGALVTDARKRNINQDVLNAEIINLLLDDPAEQIAEMLSKLRKARKASQDVLDDFEADKAAAKKALEDEIAAFDAVIAELEAKADR
jgi:uncharacterized protein YlxW (UPF0749 family)